MKEFTAESMLGFLENEYTNDFGLQWNDTTCDWTGWLGYFPDGDGCFFSFRDDTLQGLLKQMVLYIKDPKSKDYNA